MWFDRNHIVHYLIILGLILLGLVSVVLFSGNKGLQLLAVIVITLCYLLYGILHHYLEHDLTIKIVVEYVLVAALVVALYIFVNGGG